MIDSNFLLIIINQNKFSLWNNTGLLSFITCTYLIFIKVILSGKIYSSNVKYVIYVIVTSET